MEENPNSSLKTIVKTESPVLTDKKVQLNLDDLKHINDNNTNTNQNNNNRENEIVSSQKKNIFYLAFKNIKERYQYKEQRSIKIKSRNEEIIKEFKFPGTGSQPKSKDNFNTNEKKINDENIIKNNLPFNKIELNSALNSLSS